MVLRISNRDARRLWLDGQGLTSAPTGSPDPLGTIRQLGFVQLDTIQNVVRAHHHILWSRNQNYRQPMLNRLLADERSIFEHFTHDASVLPMEFYPLWHRQFKRLEGKIRRFKSFQTMMNKSDRTKIKKRIENEGALSTADFDTKIVGKKEMWARPPHKRALDFMWYAGELSTCHRENFRKFYDLTERVIPEIHRQDIRPDKEQIDWLCQSALERLGFGSCGDIQRFWEATELAEVKTWLDQSSRRLIDVETKAADGSLVSMQALETIEQRVLDIPAPTSRLRIINPFDPAIRDRVRLNRLFGFDYKIEIFVPAAKRRWGYYVYPLLEGDRFVGRIEIRADRKVEKITVINFWPEPGIKWGDQRHAKLEAELSRFCRFAGLETVEWACKRG